MVPRACKSHVDIAFVAVTNFPPLRAVYLAADADGALAQLPIAASCWPVSHSVKSANSYLSCQQYIETNIRPITTTHTE